MQPAGTGARLRHMTRSPVEGEETDPSLLLPAAIATLAALAIAWVLVAAFRGRPARPS